MLAAAAKQLIPESSSLLALHVSTLLGFAPTHNQCPKTNKSMHRRDADGTTTISSLDPAFGYANGLLPRGSPVHRVSTGCAESACTRARTLPGYLGYSLPLSWGGRVVPRCRGSSSPDERAGWATYGFPDHTSDCALRHGAPQLRRLSELRFSVCLLIESSRRSRDA